MAENFAAGYDGGVWYLIMDAIHPSKPEKLSFNVDTSLEIRFSLINNIIFFSIKYPGEPPCDAPFTPHWYNPIQIAPPTSRTGYILQYTLRPSGITRIIGLSNEFSTALYNTVIAAYKAPFEMSKYNYNINKIYNKYTPTQMWELAPANQRYIVGTADELSNKNIPDDIGYEELIKYAEYIADADTMCVYCIPECLHNESSCKNPHDYEVPVPIAYIRENGFKVVNGIIYVDAPYDKNIGLNIDDKYYE